MDGKNKANNKFNKPNDNNESLVDPKSSNHRCCAERRLLSMWEAKARKHGLRPHQITTWIRRKAGPDLVVWRTLSDGQLGCAAPCVLCRGEIVRYDFRVHCTVSDGSWYSGKLDEDGAPPCKPTAGQMRLMFGRSPYSPNSHRHRNAFHRMHATAQATLPAPPQLPREPPCAAVKPPCVQPKSLVPSQLTRGQRPPPAAALRAHATTTPPPVKCSS